MTKSSYTIKGSSDKPISIDLTSREGNENLVIFVHGFKGFKDWGTHALLAEKFTESGFNFLRFNFSHNGMSGNSTDVFDDLDAFGENTFSKELFDLDEVITFALSGQAFEAPAKLILLGHSRGGGISIIQAAEDKRISKLVTWASISNFRNLWKPEEEEKWLQEGVIYTHNSRTKQEMPLNITLLEDLQHNAERLDILDSARKVEIPWLIVHGDADASVSLKHGEELHRQQTKNEFSVIPGADHVFSGRHPWKENNLPQELKAACEKTLIFLSS